LGILEIKEEKMSDTAIDAPAYKCETERKGKRDSYQFLLFIVAMILVHNLFFLHLLTCGIGLLLP